MFHVSPIGVATRTFSGKKKHLIIDLSSPHNSTVPSINSLNHLYYIYAFSRRIYPKAFTVHSCYTYFCQYMCSLGIEPTSFALLTQCSTTEPQEHCDSTDSPQQIFSQIPRHREGSRSDQNRGARSLARKNRHYFCIQSDVYPYDAWHLFGVLWLKNVCFAIRLTFGCKSTPKIFDMLQKLFAGNCQTIMPFPISSTF